MSKIKAVIKKKSKKTVKKLHPCHTRTTEYVDLHQKHSKSQRRVETVVDKIQVVPWAFSSEWEQACTWFNTKEYTKVMDTIRLWSKRVSSVPVGAESTLYLLQAILYDQSSNSSGGTSENSITSTNLTTWSEEIARSLYSIAIIRFLNHVSHLASRKMDEDGAPVLTMTKLAASFNVPDWIVHLRHEASHGAALPSLEVLRLAGEFIRQWLVQNYWIKRDQISDSVLKSKSEEIFKRCAVELVELVAGFVWARLHKLRGRKTVTYPDVLRLIETSKLSIGTNRAVNQLKTRICALLRSNSNLTRICGVLANQMITPPEIYRELGSFNKQKSPFDILVQIWLPMLKILKRKKYMPLILEQFCDMYASEEDEPSCEVIARWVNNFLEMTQKEAEPRVTHLLCSFVAVPPKSTAGIFSNKLLEILEPSLGTTAVSKLNTLTSIWTMEDEENLKEERIRASKLRKHGSGTGHLFTVDDIFKSVDVEHNVALEGIPGENPVVPASSSETSASKWTLDYRSATFWSRLPIGAILG